MSPSLTSPRPSILTSNQNLFEKYHLLRQGDIFVGRLRLKKSEEHLLLDLVERGIILFPSALSQQVCRSKTFQAHLFVNEMLPHTTAIHDQHDMLEALNYYQHKAIGQVVTKDDRKNAGMGIFRWRDVEEVFTHSSLGSLPFPFVIQPFIKGSMDVRVIILGDYIEAYSRKNPYNFRNNLHCGGESTPYALTEKQRDLCKYVMDRGKFPYAHLDLMVLENGETYLAEINLRGGIKGARISGKDYNRKVDRIHEEFLSTHFAGTGRKF
ncbi:MAG: hypothetical protein KQH63_10980 [Desulfobulbaceae bacterium]|nr:hypothetical protein [Desulfobulbaceae bacterium]